MQGIVSGVFGSVWSTGCLIGPLIGGYVVDKIGFDMASLVIVGLYLSGVSLLLDEMSK